MRTLDYDEDGFNRKARDLIDAGEPFDIVVGGWKAKLLAPLMPQVGLGITPTTAALILGLAALAVLAAVMLYAIKKGRVVEGGGEVKKGPYKGKIKIKVK